MKKIAFMVQVLTIITTLPLLTILEINHVNGKVAGKNKYNYVNTSAEKKISSINGTVNNTCHSTLQKIS